MTCPILTALLLADLAHRHGPGPLQSFSFQARSPLFGGDPFALRGGPGDGNDGGLSAWSPDGRLAMTAAATFARPGPE